MYILRMILTAITSYFIKHNLSIGIHKGRNLCFLRGRS